MTENSSTTPSNGRSRAASHSIAQLKGSETVKASQSGAQNTFLQPASTTSPTSTGASLEDGGSTFTPRGNMTTSAPSNHYPPSGSYSAEHITTRLHTVFEQSEPSDTPPAKGKDLGQRRINTPNVRVADTSNTSHEARPSMRFNLTKGHREELRELRKGPSTPFKSKLIDANSALLTEDEKHEYLPDLELAVRWTTFLVHLDIGLTNAVVIVFGDRKALHPSDFEWAVEKVTEGHDYIKDTVCVQAHALVQELTTEDASLWDLTDNDFAKYLDGNFDTEQYFSVFDFMRDFINFEGSSKLGKWYMQNVFINLVVRVRKCMADADADSWQNVLNFFDGVALVKAHDTVDMTAFQQLTEKFRDEKELQHRRIAATRHTFISRGSAPQKEAILPFSDIRTGGMEEVEAIDAAVGDQMETNNTDWAYTELYHDTPTTILESTQFDQKSLGIDRDNEIREDGTIETSISQAIDGGSVGKGKSSAEGDGAEKDGAEKEQEDVVWSNAGFEVPRVKWNDGGFKLAVEDLKNEETKMPDDDDDIAGEDEVWNDGGF
ncbi:unnamed protein product [Zymoseptoria tritici ST99CH_1A5]|nr:unnamed protein product [Zymoseptoria tritici ST99CH_1E4]SMR44209.1 unnamed protein product [Zymoseptoria tritici ST99CH_3D1]SMY19361.1 unnamed protein product [Zymoseptoria tritici ST99CH_1A5]